MTNKYQTIWKSRHTLRVTRITQISHTKILKNKKQYLSRYGGPGTHVTQICHTKIKNIKEYVSRYGGPGTQAVSEQWGIGWDTYLARLGNSSSILVLVIILYLIIILVLLITLILVLILVIIININTIILASGNSSNTLETKCN